ncbi:MAG: peptide chain release factor 1 [Candidatus Cloacimonetes bacterium]|nr:peptide chain release factor 1 [Candidatus Cloacimonadota bacterium]
MIIPEKKITELRTEYELLKEQLSDLSLIKNQKKYREISRRFNDLNEILSHYDEVVRLKSSIQKHQKLREKETDQEFVDLIRDEIESEEEQLEKKTEELLQLLTPKDPNDTKNAIVEIRAGTGGEEAALFAADLFRMYSYYAEKMKWKLTVLDANLTGLGGYKEVIFSLEGKEVYGNIRFESGVHRVQRVPDTEASGRIHTSAITVAVLPEADEIDLEIEESDLRIDVYRASGHGGQSVNTTDSAVRISHLPSGLVVTCQDEKSQLKNKLKALKVLRAKLLDLEIAKKEAEISSFRKAQVGTGDRSGKIRTYNYAQNRVTDHRINLTSYRLEDILKGEIDEFVEALKIAYKNEMVNRR